MRDYGERLLQMERQLYDLQTEVNASRQRMVSQAATPSVRPAKIATAPTSGSDKKFGVVFLDGTFEEVIGAGDATFTDRQNSYKHVAYNLGGTQPAIGDKVFCFLASGRWWFAKGEGGGTTTIEGSAINIFSRTDLYYTSGPNAGDRVEHVVTGNTPVMLYGEGVHQQGDIAWIDRTGPDIGASAAAAGGYSINLSQVGLYRFTFSSELYRFYKYSMAPVFPDPPRTYYFEVDFDSSKSLASTPSVQRLIYATTLTTDEQCTTTTASNFEDEDLEVLSHMQTAFGSVIVKTLYTNTAFRFRGTIYYDSGDEAIEFGVVLDPILTVEKLE